MFNKLKQFKDLRSQAKQVQNQLAQETVFGSALGDKVSLVMNGNQEVMSLDINSELLSSEKKEELQKGLQEAFNEATKKVQKLIAQKVQGGDLNLPNLNLTK